MLRSYGEEWNGFQFRSPIYLDGHFDPYKFDLVKWKECEPTEVIDFTTGEITTSEKKIQTRYCFSIATLTWNRKEESFDFESVGLRYLQHRVDGLEEYILKFCEEMIKEFDEEV